MGTEILFMLGLGLLLLGPKNLHSVLGQVARTRAEWQKASHSLRAQLKTELGNDTSRDLLEALESPEPVSGGHSSLSE